MTIRKVTTSPARVAEIADMLRKLFPVGSDVHYIVSNVNRHGTARTITILAADVHPDTGQTAVRNVSGQVAAVLGWKVDDGRGAYGIRVNGCGMDMAFYTVYSLGRKLYADDGGVTLTAEAQAAMSGRRGDHRDAGYALTARGL